MPTARAWIGEDETRPTDLRLLGADDGIRTRDPHLGKVPEGQPLTCTVALILPLTSGKDHRHVPADTGRFRYGIAHLLPIRVDLHDSQDHLHQIVFPSWSRSECAVAMIPWASVSIDWSSSATLL